MDEEEEKKHFSKISTKNILKKTGSTSSIGLDAIRRLSVVDNTQVKKFAQWHQR